MKHPHSVDCKGLLDFLNAYIDGDLDMEHCSEIESHLSGCLNCKIVVNTLKKTIQLYQMDGVEITLPPEARRRLFASLNLDDNFNNYG